MQAAYPVAMAYESPRQVRRRENLRRLVDEHGGQAQVAVEIDTPKSHLSAILAGRRGIGDVLAHKIERHYEKPAGWMDADLTDQTALVDEVAKLATEANALPKHLRDRVLILWRQAISLANETLTATSVGQDEVRNATPDVHQPRRKSL